MGNPLKVLPARRGKLPPGALRAHAGLFKALGDTTRLEIVSLLAEADGELCVCEIEPRFELSQPTISHHLRLLREAGIVSAERRGSWVYYAIDPKAIETIRTFSTLLKS